MPYRTFVGIYGKLPLARPAYRSIPAWVSAPGAVNTDFRPLHAWLEWAADRELRNELGTHFTNSTWKIPLVAWLTRKETAFHNRLAGWKPPVNPRNDSDPLMFIPPGARSNVFRLSTYIRPILHVIDLAPEKARRLWNPWPNFSDARGSWGSAASGGHFFALAGLALLGIVGARRAWRTWGLLLVPAVYLTCIHAVFLGSVRYRMPAVGGFAVLAAFGVAWLVARFAPMGFPRRAASHDPAAASRPRGR